MATDSYNNPESIYHTSGGDRIVFTYDDKLKRLVFKEILH
jgi:hypothetical protein